MLSFSVQEALSAAESLEADAQRFYADAARRATDPGASRLLSRLAQWEETHRKLFADMRAHQTAASPDAADASAPEEERAQYIKAMVEGRIFAAVPDDTFTSAARVLRLALEREHEAIVLFLTLRDLVPLHKGRDAVDSVLSEEASHVRLLKQALGEVPPEASA